MESVSVFSQKFQGITNEPFIPVLLEPNDKEVSDNSSPSRSNDKLVLSAGDTCTSCSYCRVQFSDLQAQREHYKLDWHRYNLKQSLLSRTPLTEEEFNDKTGKDDLSSISGSDSEKEDTLDTFATAQGKMFLQNSSRKVFSIYKCLAFDRKEEISEEELIPRLRTVSSPESQWTILMLGGGHFAGAVFKGAVPILHKTFHCYTVRAGQGGAQSSRDGKAGGGTGPKSAGASLRRYNEQALVQHVKSIVETWKDEIERSSLIIYRASGPYNRSVLFGGSSPLIDRSSKKLRTIPFSTRRATFTELKRVHSLLSTAELFDSLEMAMKKYALERSPDAEAKRNKLRTSCINRAKSRETVERPLPSQLSSASTSETDLNKDLEDLDLASNDVNVNLSHLQEFGDSLTPEQRKKCAKKKSKPKKSKAKKLREQEEARKKELVDVIVKGDIDKLKQILDNHFNSQGEGKGEDVVRKEFINQVVDEKGNTLLHEAALNEQNDMLRFLLANNADPCLKNSTQHTPYTCTQSKVIRETLKDFAKENPDKFNYNKAQIPINALNDAELAEKRKAIRKVKKEKEKEKKKEEEIKRAEREEMDRWLRLSDREKRALAAERRIRDLSGKVITRCFNCACDIGIKVPFEYMSNLFCSIDCLKAHRLKGPILLST